MSDIVGFAAAAPMAELHPRIDGGFAREPMLAMAARNASVRPRAAPLR